MPEDAAAQTATAQTDTGTQADTASAATDPAAEVAKWKALARKHEDQAKSNSAAAQKLAQIEEANKSEAQKAADRVTAAERTASEATLKALRYEVGIEKNVPSNLLRYLTGATKEELEANAAQLIADFGADTATTGGQARRPQEALRAGASADPNQAINDRIRQAAGRRN
jgi:hypothetical protein